MANNVFANGREIACKAGAGKTIAAFPDVCFTPPENPATPPGVPIPYPNTGMASDTTDGSKKVKISDKEVGLKNKSCFKKSMGDEAGAAAKKGVITSKNRGKVFFNAWSMDVKIEGQNAVRHLDLTTNNHASVPGDTPPWPYVDKMAMPGITEACKEDMEKEEKACEGIDDPCEGVGMGKPPTGKGVKRPQTKPVADRMAHLVVCNDCLNARRCKLSPYENGKNADGESVKKTCCPGQTPHHIVEKSSFGDNMSASRDKQSPLDGMKKYDPNMAPCVCAEGTSHSLGGTHELMHVFQKAATLSAIEGQVKTPLKMDSGINTEPVNTQSYADARSTGLDAFESVFSDAGCDRECLKQQIDAYHNQCDIDEGTQVKAVTSGPAKSTMTVEQAKKEIAMRSWNRNQLPAAYRK